MIVSFPSWSISVLRSAGRSDRAHRTKIALHGELSHLGAQVPDLPLGVIERRGTVVEYLARVIKQLLAPQGDLVGMHAVPRGELGQCRIAAQRFERHPCFELRGMVPA